MSPTNLICYALQSGIVLIVGLVAPRVFGLRVPGAALRYWQALLAAVLLLPLLQPRDLAAAGSVTVEALGLQLADSVAAVAPVASAGAVIDWALLGIAAVAAARLAWLAIGLLVLRSYRLGGRPLDRLPAALDGALRGSVQGVRFLVSDRVPTPVTFGWRQPTVLVPSTFQGMPEEQRLCIGFHELIHVRRRDWLAVIAERVLRAVLWFHPAVLILLGKIELSREQLVDREVVRLTGNRRAYLDALLSMATRRQPASSAPVLFLLNRSDLVERVALLAREANMSRKKVLGILVTVISMVAVAGVSAAALFPLTKAPASVSTASADRGPDTVASSLDGEKTRQAVKYDPDAGITAPKLIHKVDPVYPEEARKNRIQGVVVCETTIDTKGQVVAVKVAKTTEEVFIQPTIDALSQWRFEPATKDGEPIDVIYLLTVKYALDDAEKDAQEKKE